MIKSITYGVSDTATLLFFISNNAILKTQTRRAINVCWR